MRVSSPRWCLYILQHCDCRGFIPDVRLTGDIYLDRSRGPNWLYYYFDLLEPTPREGTAKHIRFTKKIAEWEDIGQSFGADMSIEDAASIFHKFIRPKLHIIKIVDDFRRRLMTLLPVRSTCCS